MPLTLDEFDKVITYLTPIYNPIYQKTFAEDLFNHVITLIKTKYNTDNNQLLLTYDFINKLTQYKDEIVKEYIRNSKYNIQRNKYLLDMVDIQIICPIAMSEITIQPNSVLTVLMHGAGSVDFFPFTNTREEIEELWNNYKKEYGITKPNLIGS